MEQRSEDNVCSLYSDEAFANHITINLFKKKNNLKVARVSRRETMRANLPKPIHAVKRHALLRSRNNHESIQTITRGTNTSLSHPGSSVLNPLSTSAVYSGCDIAYPIGRTPRPTDEETQTNNSPIPNSPMGGKAQQQKSPSRHSPPKSSPQTICASTNTRTASAVSDDLTPLSWLQSLDMGGVVPHLAAPPTPPASPVSSQNSLTAEGNCKDGPASPEKIDYSVDGSVKPPYSYAALIGMAMKENDNKMTLSAIYKWIKEHFVFYKTADQSWQVRPTKIKWCMNNDRF